jgi:hypothetical protein
VSLLSGVGALQSGPLSLSTGLSPGSTGSASLATGVSSGATSKSGDLLIGTGDAAGSSGAITIVAGAGGYEGGSALLAAGSCALGGNGGATLVAGGDAVGPSSVNAVGGVATLSGGNALLGIGGTAIVTSGAGGPGLWSGDAVVTTSPNSGGGSGNVRISTGLVDGQIPEQSNSYSSGAVSIFSGDSSTATTGPGTAGAVDIRAGYSAAGPGASVAATGGRAAAPQFAGGAPTLGGALLLSGGAADAGSSGGAVSIFGGSSDSAVDRPGDTPTSGGDVSLSTGLGAAASGSVFIATAGTGALLSAGTGAVAIGTGDASGRDNPVHGASGALSLFTGASADPSSVGDIRVAAGSGIGPLDVGGGNVLVAAGAGFGVAGAGGAISLLGGASTDSPGGSVLLAGGTAAELSGSAGSVSLRGGSSLDPNAPGGAIDLGTIDAGSVLLVTRQGELVAGAGATNLRLETHAAGSVARLYAHAGPAAVGGAGLTLESASNTAPVVVQTRAMSGATADVQILTGDMGLDPGSAGQVLLRAGAGGQAGRGGNVVLMPGTTSTAVAQARDNSRAGKVQLKDDAGYTMLSGGSYAGLRLGEGALGGGSGSPATGPAPNSGVRGLALSVQSQNMALTGGTLVISGDPADGTGYALIAVRANAGSAAALTVQFRNCQTGQIVIISATSGDVTLPGSALATGPQSSKVLRSGTSSMFVIFCTSNPCVLSPLA